MRYDFILFDSSLMCVNDRECRCRWHSGTPSVFKVSSPKPTFQDERDTFFSNRAGYYLNFILGGVAVLWDGRVK